MITIESDSTARTVRCKSCGYVMPILWLSPQNVPVRGTAPKPKPEIKPETVRQNTAPTLRNNSPKRGTAETAPVIIPKQEAEQLGDYLESRDLYLECKYLLAVSCMDQGEYDKALDKFAELDDYNDSAELLRECSYQKAVHLMDEAQYADAISCFSDLGSYKDPEQKYLESLEILRSGLPSDTICAGGSHFVAIKADGTVLAVGDTNDGQCATAEWRDIVAVSAGWNYTVGLKADGTVVAVGSNGFKECEVSEWKDMVAVSAGREYTVGLKADGTVVTTGYDESLKAELSEWENIVEIEAREMAAVNADGIIVSTGSSVAGWKGIKVSAEKTQVQ